MQNSVTRITIFHYHLLPGGVTSVISLSCEALSRYLPGLRQITLAAGTEENADEVADSIRRKLEGSGVELETAILPEIGYVAGMPAAPSVSSIKSHLHRFSGSLWWIHNYHLGKNPQFTQALLEILAEDPEQQILFHIHDFPECARYENLQRLKSGISLNPYPRGRNVRYALINGRDRKLLARSGLRSEDLFLLNNPVRSSTAKAPAPVDTTAIRRKLSAAFCDRGEYTPDGFHLFYPVRTIRRKNILEAGAWTVLLAEKSGESCNLIVTLPGVSSSERRYSGAVERAFREGLIPGLWGIGRKLDGAGIAFSELGRSCDMMIASSVQEGFGYLFVEALQWGLPLFARDLDILDGMRHLFDSDSSFFYRDLLVPVSPIEAEELRSRYRQKIAHLDDHLPRRALLRLEDEIGRIGVDGYTAFSLFSVEGQLEILSRLKSPDYAARCLELNRTALDRCMSLWGRIPDSEQVRMAEEQFSFENFARAAAEIFASYSREPREQNPGLRQHTKSASAQDALVEAFAELRFMLLLYDFNGD